MSAASSARATEVVTIVGTSVQPLRRLLYRESVTRESSVEEALIEMYLASVSVRRVEDITETLWGNKVSSFMISELNKKAYVHIED